MTITETRPPDQTPAPQSKPETLKADGFPESWGVGWSILIAITALAVALVALAVSVVNSGSTRSEASAPAAAHAATPSTSVPPAAAGTIPVTLSEYKVSLPTTTVTAGVKTLQITNAGTMQHELLVFHPDASIDPSNLPVGADGNISEDAPGINKVSDGDNIGSGKSQTRQIDLTKPGTYVFVCNLPGHYKLGMWTVVVVH